MSILLTKLSQNNDILKKWFIIPNKFNKKKNIKLHHPEKGLNGKIVNNCVKWTKNGELMIRISVALEPRDCSGNTGVLQT